MFAEDTLQISQILYSGFGAFERIGGPVAAAHGRYRGLSPWHEPLRTSLLRALQNNADQPDDCASSG